MHVFALRCAHRGCQRPWANIYNGVITVESRHGGTTHTNVMALSTLLKILHNSRYALDPDEMRRMLEQLDLPVLDVIQRDESSRNGPETGNGNPLG